jgi:hypothetical protein
VLPGVLPTAVYTLQGTVQRFAKLAYSSISPFRPVVNRIRGY